MAASVLFNNQPPRYRMLAVVAVLTTLITLLLGLDLFVPKHWMHSDRSWYAAALLGCCIGQLNLIAIWGALAPGRLIVRLPWAFVLTTLMWYALAIGNHMDNGGVSGTQMMQLGVLLYVATFVALLPLWILGWSLQWMLSSPFPSHDKPANQLSIRSLLLGITVAAVLLALGRSILPVAGYRWAALSGNLMLIVPIAAIVNLLITTPAVWASYLPGKWSAITLAALAFNCVVVTALEVGVLILMLGAPGAHWIEVFFAFSVANLAQFGTIVAVLLLLRLLGYDLHRSGRESTSLEENPFEASPFRA